MWTMKSWGDAQLVGRHPVAGQQQQAREALLDRLHAVAHRGLGDLRDQRLGMAQERELHRATTPELRPEHRRRRPNRASGNLCHGLIGGRLAGPK
jgi:hypothetical protein